MRRDLSPYLLLLSLGVAALAPAVSCGGGGGTGTSSSGASSGGGTGGGSMFGAVSIEPPQVTLTVDLAGTATQTYQAFSIKGGTKTDVSTQCDWSVDPLFGSMAGPVLTALPHGGTTQVAVTCGGSTATSDLTVKVVGTVIMANTPPTAPTTFGSAQPGADPARTPAIVYPLDTAVAPLNVPPIDAQWSAAQNDLFHLSLSSTNLAIDIYTTDTSAILTDVDWTKITGTAVGGDLTFTVEGLSMAAPATKFQSAKVLLTLSHDTIDNSAIYYWASSQGNIMTQVFGSTAAPQPVKSDCTSCHSVSRAGSRIGYSRCVANDCGQIFLGFMRYDTKMNQWTDTLDANGKAIAGSYTTFAPVGNPFPDDTKSVALYTTNTGSLELIDPDTGMILPSNAKDASTQGPGAPRAGLMPDWSPDGKEVVFASTPHPGQWIDLSDSSIAVMSYAYMGGQHVFGSPSFLVSQPITLPSGVYNNFFFPSYSPDGAYIVFNAARSAWRNFQDAATPGQRLMLTDAAGAWTVDLTALNGPGDLNTTWPHWAPGETNDYLWIVYSSERPYGYKVTPQNSAPACIGNGVKQCKQLWIGAISKDKLAKGGGMPGDPSAPPVWLPGQDMGADNISPYWTVPTSAIPH